jgi:hypothetical protein
MDMVMDMMSYSTFRRRVRHNTAVLQEALDEGKPLITIISDLYTWTTAPGELHSSVLIRNAHDMLPSAYLGLLPNIQANGIDAFRVNNDGQLIEYELKTAEIRSSQIWKGPKGGLYTGDHRSKTTKSSVTSTLSAHYKFSTADNAATKRMKTVLLICDTDGPDGYFDAWEMDGDVIMDSYIRDRIGKVDIKLGSFMLHGRRAKTVVPLKGFGAWKQEIERMAPLKLAENG